jgi:hypothetical protein
MRRPRFSLRGLLVFTTLLSMLCYWRDRPRWLANRFVTVIEHHDPLLLDLQPGPDRMAGSTVTVSYDHNAVSVAVGLNSRRAPEGRPLIDVCNCREIRSPLVANKCSCSPTWYGLNEFACSGLAPHLSRRSEEV